jgi:hypothetical protein
VSVRVVRSAQMMTINQGERRRFFILGAKRGGVPREGGGGDEERFLPHRGHY